MAAQLIDGKAVAAQVHEEVRAGVAERVRSGRSAPGLATLLVGADPASEVYVGSKRKLSENPPTTFEITERVRQRCR